MPVNLELKASFGSLAQGTAYARATGAVDEGIMVQEDTYFQVQTGRLKLREIEGRGAELVAYERRETSDERWSDYSRIPVHDPSALKVMLTAALGILIVVRKRRHLFLTPEARIHLDEVGELGTFLEFEVTVADRARAQEVMTTLRKAFKIDTDENIIRTSYSDLILKKQKRSRP